MNYWSFKYDLAITLIPIFLSFFLLAFPSDIPAVSLCPPDSDCADGFPLTVLDCEAELCDSCSSLGRPSSSCQQVCLSPTTATNRNYTRLMYSVPSEISQGPQVGAYESLPPHRRHHYGPAQPKTCHNCHSNSAGPCAERSTVGQIVDRYGSAHQLSCHEAAQCHWLQGSKDSGAQKRTQRPVPTVRSVSSRKRSRFHYQSVF